MKPCIFFRLKRALLIWEVKEKNLGFVGKRPVSYLPINAWNEAMHVYIMYVQYIVCNSRWIRRFRIEHFSVTNLSPIKIFSMQKQFSFQMGHKKKTSRWVAKLQYMQEAVSYIVKHKEWHPEFYLTKL